MLEAIEARDLITISTEFMKMPKAPQFCKMNSQWDAQSNRTNRSGLTSQRIDVVTADIQALEVEEVTERGVSRQAIAHSQKDIGREKNQPVRFGQHGATYTVTNSTYTLEAIDNVRTVFGTPLSHDSRLLFLTTARHVQSEKPL